MGGLAGRSDGICGAVECQKLTGSLHLHFWNFIQRLHQYKTLAEITEYLEKCLIHADELKDFCALHGHAPWSSSDLDAPGQANVQDSALEGHFCGACGEIGQKYTKGGEELLKRGAYFLLSA